MVERQIEGRQLRKPIKRFLANKPIRKGLSLLVAVGIAVLPFAPGVGGAIQVNSYETTAITTESSAPDSIVPIVSTEVGDLTGTPILRVFSPGRIDPIRDERWDLGKVWQDVDVSPDLLLYALKKTDLETLLTTVIETDGKTNGCVYSYPDTTKCNEFSALNPSITSYYPFRTDILDPGRVYGDLGAARLRVGDKPGVYTITMSLNVNDATKALIMSESTRLEVLDIKKAYLPLLAVGNNGSNAKETEFKNKSYFPLIINREMPHLRRIAPVQGDVDFMEALKRKAYLREKILPEGGLTRARDWQRRRVV